MLIDKNYREAVLDQSPGFVGATHPGKDVVKYHHSPKGNYKRTFVKHLPPQEPLRGGLIGLVMKYATNLSAFCE